MSSAWLQLARSRRLILLIALIGGVVVFAGIFQTSAGYAILRMAGLSQQPTGSTSLSFVKPRSLPELLQSKHAKVTAPFVIENATNTAHNYTWSIFLIRQGQTERMYTGNVSLTPGGKVEIARSVTIECTRGEIRIVVSLAHPAESISALMACPS